MFLRCDSTRRSDDFIATEVRATGLDGDDGGGIEGEGVKDSSSY